MKHFIALAFAAAIISVPSMAFADRAYDFSDLASFRLELPFKVTNVEVNGSGMESKQIYYLADSYDSVIKKLSSMYDKKQTVGVFYVNGLTKQTVETMYQLQLAYKNEHHYAQIRPNGSGCTITFEIRPVSYVSGVYEHAIYSFHMPDGGGVMPVLYNLE